MHKIFFIICIMLLTFLLNDKYSNALKVKIDGNNIEVKTNNNTSYKSDDSVSVIIDSNTSKSNNDTNNSKSDSSVSIGTVEGSENNGKNITRITNLNNVTIVHDGDKKTRIIQENEQR